MEPKMDLSQSAGLQDLLQSDALYAGKYAIAVTRATSYNASDLHQEYSAEYCSWGNRKSWAKKNKVIWSEEMNRFSDFLVVNGPIPQKSWTLDRIQPTGAYVPENLRWASKALQTRNRTSTRAMNIGGELLTVSEIAKRTGQTYDAVRMTLNRHGEQQAKVLLSIARAEMIASEESRWEFPEEYRVAIELRSQHAVPQSRC